MPRFRLLGAVGAALILSLAAAGCSGDSDTSGAAASTVNGSSVNLAESVARIGTLKSFRFSGSMSMDYQGSVPSTTPDDMLGGAMFDMLVGALKDVQVEGAVVAPDQMELKIKLSGQELGFIQLGDKAWAKFFGAWESVEPEDLGLAGGINLSDLSVSTVPPEVVEPAKVTKESVNGINATRYSFDEEALQKLADDTDSGQEIDSGTMDVWLTDEGVPVKLALKMNGKDEAGQNVAMQLEFALKDLNSNITIKAPN